MRSRLPLCRAVIGTALLAVGRPAAPARRHAAAGRGIRPNASFPHPSPLWSEGACFLHAPLYRGMRAGTCENPASSSVGKKWKSEPERGSGGPGPPSAVAKGISLARIPLQVRPGKNEAGFSTCKTTRLMPGGSGAGFFAHSDFRFRQTKMRRDARNPRAKTY
jgi:hypothetical protein